MNWYLRQHHGHSTACESSHYWSPGLAATSFQTKPSPPHHNAPTTQACHGIRSSANRRCGHCSQPQSISRRVCRVSSFGSAVPDAEGISDWHQTPSSTCTHARPRSNFYSPSPRLRGIRRRELRLHPKPRLPITINIIGQMKSVLRERLDLSTDDCQVYWAAFTTAFFGFLRCSEFTTPSVSNCDKNQTLVHSDLTTDSNGYRLHINAAKMDPFCLGVNLFLRRTHHSVCPVKALKDCLACPRDRIYRNLHTQTRLECPACHLQPVISPPPAGGEDLLETFATQTNRRLSIIQSECRSMFVHPR